MRFSIMIEPVGQMRPRAYSKGKHSGMHKDPKQRVREEELAAMLLPHRPPVPMAGPLVLHMDCHLKTPKTTSRDVRRDPFSGEVIPTKAWKHAAAAGIIRPTKKPDCTNTAKHIEDVMQSMGFFDDDSQIVELVVRKWWSTEPRWGVYLEHLALHLAAEADKRMALPGGM